MNDEKINKKSLGAKNKHKGSHAERHYVKVFRELGYTKCVTARLGSRLHDNAGIDIMNIPFNIQIKAGIQKSMNSGKVLFNTESQIISLFPEDADVTKYPILLIHRPEPFSSNTSKDILYMSLRQFNIFKELNASLEYETIKERVYKMENQFCIVVSMKFDYFKEKILTNTIYDRRCN